MLLSSCSVSLALVCLFAIGVSKAEVEHGKVDVATSDAIAQSVMSFALNLTQKMNTDYHKTLIFSPLSIMSALAMILLGAKGRSHLELSSLFGQSDMVTLHEQFGMMLNDVQQLVGEGSSRHLDSWHSDSLQTYPKDRIGLPEVHVANGLFVQKDFSINPNYRQALTLNYKSEAHSLDFEKDSSIAKNIINAWVNEQTKGKITDIISDNIDASTLIVLVNTLYFKANWETDFIGNVTRKHKFYPNGLGSQPVLSIEAMIGDAVYPYYENRELKCHIIGIPYHGHMTTMYVIKPLESSVERLAQLQQKLTADIIDRMISKMRRISANVVFPKMHITESIKLRELLQSMGIGGMFTPTQNDLSLIVTREKNLPPFQPDVIGSLQILDAQRQAESMHLATSGADLFISEIVHKVDFNIDETGTEAAAASAVFINYLSYPMGPHVNFLVDTPFILLIRNDLTKLALFYSIINEPPSQQTN